MALKKRKPSTSISDVRVTGQASGEPAAKRIKRSEESAAKVFTRNEENNSYSLVSKSMKSVLKREEETFPRGGADVLTPLERKQVLNEATRDALFEHSDDKQAPNSHIGVERNDGTHRDAKRTYGKARRHKVNAPVLTQNEPRVRVEGLSYRRLVPGSIVLGQISQITSRDIAVALPNNLTGFIPLTAVSDQLSQKLDTILGEENTEDDGDTPTREFEDVDPSTMFRVGQFLRAYVTSNGSEESRSKRHIELSINPRLANSGLGNLDLVVNSLVQASVVSVEDHGMVMDIGVATSSVNPFLSTKELGTGFDIGDIKEGTVFLCLITSTKGGVLKLSADLSRAGDIKKVFLSSTPSVNTLLPGNAVEILVTATSATDVTGKIMGIVDATADHIHSGNPTADGAMDERYKIGMKIKGRIIFTLPKGENQRVGLSLLPNILSLSSNLVDTPATSEPLNALRLSAKIKAATVMKVEPKLGLFMDVGVSGFPAFAHISRISDSKVDDLSSSSKYAVGTKHAARVIGFNPMDSLFLISLEESTLNQPFLRIEDIQIGSVVRATVERLVITERGVGGMLVKLAEGITGLVPEIHLADVHLQHPERKFREGMKVTARVLSTNPERRRIRLTLKKSLVNTDFKPWTSYKDIAVGDQSPGTIINVLGNAAIVQFFDEVRGFLPVSEMSEAYIKDPSEHFKVGQVVNVHVLRIEAAERKMIVSCKDPSTFGDEQRKAFAEISVGQLVSGTVTGLATDLINLDLDAGIKAVLRLQQLTDGSEKKNLTAMKKISVSNKIKNLLVLEKLERSHSVILSNKPSLVKAARNGTLITSFDQFRVGERVEGFVRNVAGDNIFVQFAAGVVGLLHRNGLPEEHANAYAQGLPQFGLRIGQSLSTTVTRTDLVNQRVSLSMTVAEQNNMELRPEKPSEVALRDPVDGVSRSIEDFTLGKLTKARIKSIKNTQLNVILASNVQARVDISEAFDRWEDIPDKKNPLASKFEVEEVIAVKVIGIHSARTHRFLPFSHRRSSNTVYELSARGVNVEDDRAQVKLLTLDKVNVNSSYTAFVNNHSERGLFVHISPQVRAQINLVDLTDDISLLTHIESNYPVGSAIKVTVRSVDLTDGRLELTARSGDPSNSLSYRDLKKGMVLPARVTKVTERYIMVQVNQDVAGQVPLTEITDDYAVANPTIHHKNDILRVCVVSIDLPNKKVSFSTRPSQVLSSSLPVKDRHISSAHSLEVNDVVRGFICNVADSGIFVKLGPEVTAFVKVANLSDAYIRDWKPAFEIDQLVCGKVIAVDPSSNRVQMSLRASHVENDYAAPIVWSDVREGQVVTGKVRKVEDFGVFIVIDNSENVSGLCHRTEIADAPMDQIKKLYKEGDLVKAIVLKVEKEKRRISFGLKASYFHGNGDENGGQHGGSDTEMNGLQIELEESDEHTDEDGGIDLREVKDFDIANSVQDIDTMEVDKDQVTTSAPVTGLRSSGFNWDGNVEQSEDEGTDGISEDDEKPKKHRTKKAEIQIDRTGDLDKYGPQSVADFERQLLGEPNNSALWIQYMAFQLQLHEIEKARDIAERALRTIHMSEQEEKLNIWTAWLNLENSFGSDEALDTVFERACQYTDKQELHERLASICIESGKHEVSMISFSSSFALLRPDTVANANIHKRAHDLFRRMSKLKDTTAKPDFWLNYATFLLTTLNAPVEARQLLQRASQSLHPSQHRLTTAKFALLEFHSPNGDPERGRTVFEGLVSTWPRRWDLWDLWVAAEIRLLRESGDGKRKGSKEAVRALFERMTRPSLKPKRARFVFRQWAEWEESVGETAQKERVVALAREWVLKHQEKGEEAG